MKILFLHPNFPAQFKNIVKPFSTLGHEVIFLCQTHYGRTIANVERVCLKGELGDDFLQKQSVDIFHKTQIRASQYKDGFFILKNRNWYPDLVISHASWGCGIHLREFWPQTKVISYLEWWYDYNSALFQGLESNSYLNLTVQSISKFCLRNQPVALELLNSDVIVTPTMFQLLQLPPLLQANTEVIFDGIDLSIFSPGIKHTSPKVTYGTRGMEPLRGFPQFIKEIPRIRHKFPDVIIEIAGSDQAFYFPTLPDGFTTWKKWAIDYLSKNNAADCVVWKGVMHTKQYSDWLKSSWAHVYLSEPFVPSWSMIESIITCPNVFLSDNPMTREFAVPEYTEFVNHNDQCFLSANRKFCDIMAGTCVRDSNLADIRSAFADKYSLDSALGKWGSLLSDVTSRTVV